MMRGRIFFIGRGKCNEIGVVIVRARMHVLRDITVVFKCTLASCRTKMTVMWRVRNRNIGRVIKEI